MRSGMFCSLEKYDHYRSHDYASMKKSSPDTTVGLVKCRCVVIFIPLHLEKLQFDLFDQPP